MVETDTTHHRLLEVRGKPVSQNSHGFVMTPVLYLDRSYCNSFMCAPQRRNLWFGLSRHGFYFEKKRLTGMNAHRFMKTALVQMAMTGGLCLSAVTVAHAQNMPNLPSNPGLGPTMETQSRNDAGTAPALFGAPFAGGGVFGNWLGAKDWLQDHGLTIAAAFHDELAGNFHGGARQGVDNAGQVGVTLDVDWGKIAGIDGFASHMLVVNGFGRNLSGDYIKDPLTQPQQIYGARGNVVAHLVYLYHEKTFYKNRIDVNFGWLPVGTFFFASPLFCNFANVSLCGNPAPNKYTPGFKDWPSSNLGAVVRLMPTNDTYIMAGLFAVSPHSSTGGISGWAWAQDGLGKFSTPVEVGWLPEFGKNHLDGHYKAGFGYDNSHYTDLYEDIHGNPWVETGLPARRQSGMSTAWVQGDQMLVRNGAGSTNGLLVLGGYMWNSGHIVAMRDHEWVGLIDSGASWGRPNDSVGILYQRFNMSRAAMLQQETSQDLGLPFQSNQWGTPYGVQTHENVYELYYNFHAFRGVDVKPDFQYLNRPGATTRFPDAAVMLLQLNAVL